MKCLKNLFKLVCDKSVHETYYNTLQRSCAICVRKLMVGGHDIMMTSSNGNIFRVTGHLCGKFTGPRWISHTKASDAELDVFFDLRLNKRLSKQPWGWWFETPAWSLWRHRNVVYLKKSWRGYGRSNNPVVRRRCRSLKFSNKYDNIERNTHTRAHAHKICILYLYNISKSVSSVTTISRTDFTECWCKLFVNGSDLFQM